MTIDRESVLNDRGQLQAVAEAGPSSPQSDGLMTIPTTGVQYFEYRRALFLAGVQPPLLPTPLPEYITVRRPPPPLDMKESARSTLSPKMAKLDTILSRKGATRNVRVVERVEHTLADLKRGKTLPKGMTLSLMIKIYKFEWTLDGLWPIDKATGEPAIPPDSPIASVPELPES